MVEGEYESSGFGGSAPVSSNGDQQGVQQVRGSVAMSPTAAGRGSRRETWPDPWNPWDGRDSTWPSRETSNDGCETNMRGGSKRVPRRPSRFGPPSVSFNLTRYERHGGEAQKTREKGQFTRETGPSTVHKTSRR
jgi:hypothetical protein